MHRRLVQAKFFVPSPRRGVVPRARLHERLSSGEDARLSVVVAPAGWGKTTLLAAWVAELDRAHAWLSLDRDDDEPIRFWTYVLSAIGRVAPELVREARDVLEAPGLDPVMPALETLLNTPVTARSTCTLVLDDYHVVTDPEIHTTMEFLLAYLPPGTLRIIIASRADPPLPLARLRARGELAELRLDDLRCSPAEGSALITAVAGEVTPAVATELVRHTEGWPAALQISALARRTTGDRDATSAPADDRHVLDYVTSEVLPGLTVAERDLLVRTSVLDRLTGSLCDAVLQTTGSAAVLDRLSRADLFVSRLVDAERPAGPSAGDWYRCHQLLRDVLRRELDLGAPGEAGALLERAAAWFLARDRIEDAVTHRLAAGDESQGMAMLAEHTRWFLEHGAMASLLRLGRGPALSLADPHLYLSLAFAAALTGRPDEVHRWLSRAEPLITDDAPPLPGWRSLRAGADATWAAYLVERDGERALRRARNAVALESDPDRWGYVVARQSLAGALHADDQAEAAIALLLETWRLPVRRELPLLLTLQHAGALALALVDTGRLGEGHAVLAEVAEQARLAEQEWGVGAAAAVAEVRLAEAMGAAAHDPAGALASLRQALTVAERYGQPSVTVAAALALADAEWTTGDTAAARRALDRAGELVRTETTARSARRHYEEAEQRIGRSADTTARTDGRLSESLTDRELSILRALRGPLSAREIAAELYLSINTIKGYTKSLYRKLDVATRSDAVQRGRQLGLI